MYTVFYTNSKGQDTYDRFESLQEVADLLIREDLRDCPDDVIIFPPEAEDDALSIDDVFNGI